MNVDASSNPDDLTRLLLAVARTLLDDSGSLVTGRVPDGWPTAMIPPQPVVVLGGFSAGHSLSAVFVYPQTTERPLAEYASFLGNDGWTTREDDLADGFRSTTYAMLRRGSSLALLRRSTSDPAEKSIVVSLSSVTGPQGPRAPFDTLGVRRLDAPPGVKSDGGGGSSGGGSKGYAQMTRHIHVVTDLSPAELLPFYATQLADAGWTTGEVQTTNASATQWLTATDAQGRVWRGLLVVYLNGSASEVFIYMATAKPDRIARAE